MSGESENVNERTILEAALVAGLTGVTDDEGRPVRVAILRADGGLSLDQEAGLAALLADRVLAIEPDAEPSPTELGSWTYTDIPVIDGVATFPNGATVRSSSQVVRFATLQDPAS